MQLGPICWFTLKDFGFTDLRPVFLCSQANNYQESNNQTTTFTTAASQVILSCFFLKDGVIFKEDMLTE